MLLMGCMHQLHRRSTRLELCLTFLKNSGKSLQVPSPIGATIIEVVFKG